jgi:hypothetical protein
MRAIWLVLLVALLAGRPVTSASTISLTASQRAKLVSLVDSEPEVQKLFRKLKREADASVHEKGNPIAKIRTAGKIETDPLKVESRASLEDMKKLHALGYVYAITSNSIYGAATRRIILHWAEVNQPTGVPIDETKFEPLFVAYDLTRDAFSIADSKIVEHWLRQMARLELQSAQTNSVTASNNWNSHRLKIVGLIGFLLQDTSLIEQAVRGFKKQIEVNLYPDGSSFDFHQRDALHYHCYDLEPLLVLAIAAQQNGVDLYDYRAAHGACLAKSVSFLVPYGNGTKTHAEWVHSKVKFDRQRAEAGEKGFSSGSIFDPREARAVFQLAAVFDASYAALALRLFDRSAVEYPNWQALLNKVRRAE